MPYNVADLQVVATGGAKVMTTQLTTGVAAVGPLNACTVDLFTNNFTPAPSNILTDFTIPTGGTWAGYAAKAVTSWGSQQVGADGRVFVEAQPLMEWIGPAGGAGPTVYGYLVKSPLGGTPLLYSVKFATPKPMIDSNSALDLVVTFTYPNAQ